MVKKLTLSRDQLSTFLTDHEQIKQFEALFRTVDSIAPKMVEEIGIDAANAIALANTALGQLSQIIHDATLNSAVADSKAQQALGAVAVLAQDAAIAASSAENKAQLALDTIAGIGNIVELLATAPPPREYKRSRYGSFYDTTTQVAPAINTATAVTFNNTDLSRGVSLNGGNTRITVDTDGIYNLQLSVQLDKTTGGTAEFFIWFRLKWC